MALEEGRLLLACKDGNIVSVSRAAARKVPALEGLCEMEQNTHALPFHNAAAVARALRALDADIPRVPGDSLGATLCPGACIFRVPGFCRFWASDVRVVPLRAGAETMAGRLAQHAAADFLGAGDAGDAASDLTAAWLRPAREAARAFGVQDAPLHLLRLAQSPDLREVMDVALGVQPSEQRARSATSLRHVGCLASEQPTKDELLSPVLSCALSSSEVDHVLAALWEHSPVRRLVVANRVASAADALRQRHAMELGKALARATRHPPPADGDPSTAAGGPGGSCRMMEARADLECDILIAAAGLPQAPQCLDASACGATLKLAAFCDAASRADLPYGVAAKLLRALGRVLPEAADSRVIQKGRCHVCKSNARIVRWASAGGAEFVTCFRQPGGRADDENAQLGHALALAEKTRLGSSLLLPVMKCLGCCDSQDKRQFSAEAALTDQRSGACKKRKAGGF
jgi:hypothetical protein